MKTRQIYLSLIAPMLASIAMCGCASENNNLDLRANLGNDGYSSVKIDFERKEAHYVLSKEKDIKKQLALPPSFFKRGRYYWAGCSKGVFIGRQHPRLPSDRALYVVFDRHPPSPLKFGDIEGVIYPISLFADKGGRIHVILASDNRRKALEKLLKAGKNIPKDEPAPLKIWDIVVSPKGIQSKTILFKCPPGPIPSSNDLRILLDKNGDLLVCYFLPTKEVSALTRILKGGIWGEVNRFSTKVKRTEKWAWRYDTVRDSLSLVVFEKKSNGLIKAELLLQGKRKLIADDVPFLDIQPGLPFSTAKDGGVVVLATRVEKLGRRLVGVLAPYKIISGQAVRIEDPIYAERTMNPSGNVTSGIK